jgi:molybdenum cofactor synthesis domain-containing protein
MSETPRYDLLDKNELTLTDVDLDDADLGAVAAAVASVIELEHSEVLVTDYLDQTLTLDILRPNIYPHQLLGKDGELLMRLRQLPGVSIGPKGTVSSRGMLGWIAADVEEATEALRRAEVMAHALDARISKRAVVFSTGAEIASGQVRDTNEATIATALKTYQFTCDHGGVLRDDVDLVAGAIRTAIRNGYGLVITTGGVGAESKDCTVEAVLTLDPAAHTPYVCNFEKGHGRHVKDGVRIAVGHYLGSRIVSLPGPNAEVAASMKVLVDGLRRSADSAYLATAIAEKLRGLLRTRMRGDHR